MGRQQISQIKTAQASGGGGVEKEISQLRVENNQLKAEVESWKSKLTAAETANGKQMVSASVKKPAEKKEPAATGEIPPAAGTKQEKKPKGEKKEKPPKEKKEVK